MNKTWKITFPNSTTVKAETPKEAFSKAVEELYRFWALTFLLGGEPIKEIPQGE